MKNIAQMMKQAQALQSKMNTLQEDLKKHEIDGSAGAGMVKITLNGKGDIQKLKIDPSIVNADDVEMLEDLIIAAYRDGKDKVETYVNQEMSKIGGGLGDLPLPF